MKKNYLNVFGFLSILGGTLFLMSGTANYSINGFHATKLNSSGAQSARTGAPGESSCTSCHAGTAQDGNNGINTLTLDGGGTDYDPGVANSMTLTLTDAANKNGFQLVALDGNNEMAGSYTITDATNTQLTSNTQLSRDYVTHTSPGTGQSSWSFDWDAPTGLGDVTFYVATNKTNSSSTSSGDVIYLSSHTFSNPQLSADEELVENDKIEVGYAPTDHALIIDFPVEISNMVSVNVLDLSGKSVYFNNEGDFEIGNYKEKVRLPESIEDGIYVVTLFIGNKPYSKKVMVVR
tara:strand:+ start:20874 stop:21749 length:876 start_codon:yes stop_codon:yes gene_type:complete